MGKIHDVQKLTDNRFVNLYHVDATSVHNTPVSYYVASREMCIRDRCRSQEKKNQSFYEGNEVGDGICVVVWGRPLRGWAFAPPLKTHHNTGMGMKGDAVRERP